LISLSACKMAALKVEAPFHNVGPKRLRRTYLAANIFVLSKTLTDWLQHENQQAPSDA